MSQRQPKVVVVDEGQLADVRRLLDSFGVAWLDASQLDGPPESLRLLVTDAHHALGARKTWRRPDTLHLVVYDEVSRTLRGVLTRSGCDFVLQAPLNPVAFELLVGHALYRGPERRRHRRVLLSCDVKIQAGRRAHPATLLQLSLRGCGLTTRAETSVGAEIDLLLPRELVGGKPVSVPAHVLSVGRRAGKRYDVAIGFRPMSGGRRKLIRQVMEQRGIGTELKPRPDGSKPSPAEAFVAAVSGGPAPTGNQRRSPRKTFTRRVLAAGAGYSHVLFGRDLSTGGMRVRPDADLDVGDELKLALHGRPGQPALMLKAQVKRDDGDGGLVLFFLDPPAGVARRLEELVESLPTLPTGKRASTRARPGVIVTEVVSSDKRS